MVGMLCLSLSLNAAPVPDAVPRLGVIFVLAAEAEYQAAEGPERTFAGVLERGTGSRRGNMYRLVLGRSGGEEKRELHLPGRAHLLQALGGARVRVVGVSGY